MAYVKVLKIRSKAHLSNSEDYLRQQRTDDEVRDAGPNDQDKVAEDFERTAKFWGKEGGVLGYHIIQSIDAEKSKTITSEEFNSIGKDLVENKMPGHQYIVVTQTDQKHMHNHILVCSVNAENGRKIENKKKFLYDLRDESNRLCEERGITIDWGKYKSKNPDRLPDKVRYIRNRNGNSWLLDLRNKADAARSIAVNYDTYLGYLDALGVKARVENKNITYFYSDKKSETKRGKTLGKAFDTKGLEKQFAENQLKLTSSPEIQNVWSVYEQNRNREISQRRADGKLLLAPGEAKRTTGIDTSTSQHTKRRLSKYSHPSERDPVRAIVSVQQFNQARFGNILDYCRENKIKLNPHVSGGWTLKGKDFAASILFSFGK